VNLTTQIRMVAGEVDEIRISQNLFAPKHALEIIDDRFSEVEQRLHELLELIKNSSKNYPTIDQLDAIVRGHVRCNLRCPLWANRGHLSSSRTNRNPGATPRF
jgi:hypothetical protein